MALDDLPRWQRWPALGGRFAGAVAARYVQDHGPSHAAGLTFTSLLALVPLASLGFAIFAGLPVFDRLLADFERFLAANLAPQLGEQASDYLLTFVANTRKLTLFATLVLSISAVALLFSLQRAFNVIWRVQMRRPGLLRAAGFAVVVLAAPLLIGLSVTLTSLVFTGLRSVQDVLPPGALPVAGRLVPLVIAALAFWSLYLVMPRRPVRPNDALLGAVLAGVLFELTKVGFAYYVSAFPAYRTIYGALSSVPVFLIWLYLVWTVVLVGAEVCAVREAWRMPRKRRLLPDGPLRRLIDVLTVLAVLDRDARYGDRSDRKRRRRHPGAIRFNRLSALGGLPGARLETALALLTRAGYVRRFDAWGRWTLAVEARAISLVALARLTGLALEPEIPGHLATLSVAPAHRGWLQRLTGYLHARAASDARDLDASVGDILDGA